VRHLMWDVGKGESPGGKSGQTRGGRQAPKAWCADGAAHCAPASSASWRQTACAPLAPSFPPSCKCFELS
jgi:hypothetical protein